MTVVFPEKLIKMRGIFTGRDNKVAFFEAQKENLKNRKADSLVKLLIIHRL